MYIFACLSKWRLFIVEVMTGGAIHKKYEMEKRSETKSIRRKTTLLLELGGGGDQVLRAVAASVGDVEVVERVIASSV